MDTSFYQEDKQEIEKLRNQARESGTTASKMIIVNGRELTITASLRRSWLFFKGTNIKIESKTIDGRTCTVDFTYDKVRNIDKKLEAAKTQLQKQISEIDEKVKAELAKIYSKIADYSQPMFISDIGFHASRICHLLKEIENFVLQNDLIADEILGLKSTSRILCSAPFIECSNGSFSINECDSDPHCRAIALRAESFEILLDAKACGQVGLSPVKVLGRGEFNTVQLAHTKDGIPIVLKPCDQSKSENDRARFAHETQSIIGRASGSRA
jgi:hypothetical protein